MKRTQLLRQIQEYAFAVNELTLYLDSHPHDGKALEMHRALSKEMAMLEAAYNKEFGPLTAANGSHDEKWRWVDSPWPWENNCEVK